MLWFVFELKTHEVSVMRLGTLPKILINKK
jgi:hypothetical protein